MGCSTAARNEGVDFGTVAANATTTFKISLPLLGLFSSMT